MDKNYRIHTNISSDTILNVNMKQDFDFLEILSLKLRQKDAYRLHSSNYGVIVGRVLANDAFGIPNAKVSLFIEKDDNDPTFIESIYPYSEVTSRDSEGRRYNLLPDYSDDDCYRVVGTFPNKRLVLDDNTQLEVYDKYWIYTTVTNNAGDYMIFGVPSGSQQIHVDIDLSDIGILSQMPTDFEYKGYNATMFDSPKQFKESTNLDGLAQIISQNKSVFVYPFWGDVDNGVAAITRNDIQVQYKFEPTCVFMGSIVSDNSSNSIGHKCAPSVKSGMNNQLIASEGTIEMIRKTVDGFIEEYQIRGNRLINSDGVWCYQIPMNLDYIGTDEYGNIVPTDNPNKGIATRAQVRFRISKDETGDEAISRHTAKYLVPMNPMFSEDNVIPTINIQGKEIERMYTFGTSTPQSCFRDLYWNNVYSVKNYIPRTQVAHRANSKNYNALKGSNLADDQTQIPFNKLYISLPFTYIIICLVFTIVTYIIKFINRYIIKPINDVLIRNINRLADKKILGKRWFSFLHIDPLRCIHIAGNIDSGDKAYFPGCGCPGSYSCKNTPCPDDMENDCNKSSDEKELIDSMQQKLAEEFEVIRLDLHQDWINGCLYMPLWYWRKRKKRKFLFWTINRAKNQFCSCEEKFSKLKTVVTCNVKYSDNSLRVDGNDVSEKVKLWHKSQKKYVRYWNGLIKPVENNDGLIAYYYVAVQATANATNPNEKMENRTYSFPAVRLYATDIILLGNLRENNLYGIPQFFTTLPSTTANVPPIATIQESNNEKNEKENSVDTGGEDDSGTTITTGMDWGHKGDKQTPKYGTGLFLNLSCTAADSKVKSCFNVERISEYGVNLDMSYNVSYANGSNAENVEVGPIAPDGFVTKLELDDMENRAMFATMNHIGFIPQDYQDSIGGYTTQVHDDSTNYLVPKFKFIYPVDFDGRMKVPISRYKGGFEQALFDETDEQYLTFRLGAEKSETASVNSEQRIRHFYIHPSDNEYHMPLYNNSFYFYFGVKPGSTAIDKFNEMFNATCYKNIKLPFTLVVESQGVSYCPDIYNANTDENSCEYSKNYAYGYIRVIVDDIKTPFTYALYDANNIEVVRETSMTLTDFVIGGTVITNNGRKCVKVNENGYVKYQIPNDQGSYDNVIFGTDVYVLTNQRYTLEVIDSEGRMLSQRVNLEKTKVNANIEVEPLGIKFYDYTTSRIDYICNKKNNLYGKIRITNILVDGYLFDIINVVSVGYNSSEDIYRFNITARRHNTTETPIDEVKVYLTLKANSTEIDGATTKDCMCAKGNAPANLISPSWDLPSMPNANYYAEVVQNYNNETNPPTALGTYSLVLNVYQPSSFIISITQYCGENNLLEDNTTSILIDVLNGQNFNTYLNEMPIRFMIGTTNDSKNATIANNSLFYSSNIVTNPTLATPNNISGWYGLHDENSYTFPQTVSANERTWEDFVDLDLGIDDLSVKQKILQFKFEKMFSLSDAAYVTTDSNATFEYTATGGGSRTLFRSVTPYYESDVDTMLKKYILTDYNTSTLLDTMYPHIVGNNYKDRNGENGPLWNKEYNYPSYLGNYFAAFSMNGRYVTNKTIDCNINTMRLPNYSTQFPSNSLKQIGKDITGQIGSFKYAYDSQPSQNIDCQTLTPTQPYLRALYIDRRVDFDFTILGPCMGENFTLYGINNTVAAAKDRIWKSARICGYIYNGIEMAYDEEYNIISAKSESNGFSPNNRLEYSYSSSSGNTNARTQYNKGNSSSVWHKDNVWRNVDGSKTGYNAGVDIETAPLIKQPYDSSFGDVDLRCLYWSQFNKYRLNYYFNNQQLGTNGLYNLNLPFYVYGYPNNGLTKPYNNDFNRENVVAGQYPTVRYLDIGNIRPSESYDFSYVSCNYNTSVAINSDESIESKAANGESFDFSVNFSSPVEFIPPTDNNADYGNIVYKKVGNGDDEYVKFESKEILLNFKYTSRESDDFNVYTKAPKIIKVLTKNGYIDNNKKIDGITYYKTASLNGGRSEILASGRDITEVLNKSEIWLCDLTMTFQLFFMKQEITLPSGVSTKSNFKLKDGSPVDGIFFWKDDDWLTSDDNDFTNIIFTKEDNADTPSNTKILENASVITIIVEREYLYQNDDNLKRRLKTVECSDLIDARHLLIKENTDTIPVKNDDGTIENLTASYVIATRGSVYPPEVVIDVKPDQGSVEIPDQEPQGVVTDVHDEKKGTYTLFHNQVLTFRMKFDMSGTPPNWQCQAFASYDIMSYIFKFSDKNNRNIYYINCNEFYVTKQSDLVYYIDYVVKWTQDMGILADPNWQNNTKVEIYAKTPSNFTYKVSQFLLEFNADTGQEWKVDPDYDCGGQCNKTNMQTDVRCKTTFNIKR